MLEVDMTEVTVAPGHSMREPTGNLTTARYERGSAFEVRVVDSPMRVVLPGQTLFVRGDAVPQLVSIGAILDPATAASAQEFAQGPAERSR